MNCWVCGKEASTSKAIGLDVAFDSVKEKKKPNPYKRCYCSECFENYKKDLEEKKTLMVKLKKELMFETALDTLEHQHFNFYKNKEAIEVVYDKLKASPDSFDSSYEIITAIILVTNRIYSKTQYKIDTYLVDFLLADYHIVLEIDGDRHKYNKGKDSVRDENIKRILGEDWEIIRIPTDLIKKDASKIPEAINKVLEYRERGSVDWRSLYK